MCKPQAFLQATLHLLPRRYPESMSVAAEVHDTARLAEQIVAVVLW